MRFFEYKRCPVRVSEDGTSTLLVYNGRQVSMITELVLKNGVEITEDEALSWWDTHAPVIQIDMTEEAVHAGMAFVLGGHPRKGGS